MTEDDIEYLDGPHEYFMSGIRLPSVTEIVGTVSASRNGYSFVPRDKLEAARARGKRIHEARHQFDEDDLDWDAWSEIYPEDIPYIRSYAAWKQVTGFTPIANEVIVVNRLLGYAGRLDIKGILFGRLAIIDTKTGVVEPTTALQTAGYALADGLAGDCDRYALKLFRDGRMAKLVPYTDPLDFIVFKAFVTAYNWLDKNG